MPSTDRLSNIARARVSAVVLDEASGRERAATEVFNKVDADGDGTITKAEFAPFYEKLKSQAYDDGAGDGGPPDPDDSPGNGMPGGMQG